MDIRDFGAVGDGVTLNTAAFQKAIDELARVGGGHVVVPQGVWLTAPSSSGATLTSTSSATPSSSSRPTDRSMSTPFPRSPRACFRIRAERCTNISITGEGTIDGNGAQWRPVKRGKVSDVEWKRFKKMGGVERQEGPPGIPGS